MKRNPRPTVEPHYLRIMHDKLGSAALADLIGCTTGSITESLNAGRVTKEREVACEAIWRRDQSTQEREDPRLVVLRCKAEDMDVIAPMLNRLGISFTDLGAAVRDDG